MNVPAPAAASLPSARRHRAKNRWPQHWCLLLLLFSQLSLLHAKPPAITVRPSQPKSGESVTVEIEARHVPSPAHAALEYQVVEPGRFIAKDTPDYHKGWVRLPMSAANGTGGSLRAEVPAAVQKHRRLIRLRVVDDTTGKPTLPEPDDNTPNHAYFVYDGIPAWKAAVNPKGSGDASKPADFSADLLRTVQAYHLISTRKMIEGAMWKEPISFGSAEAHEYRWTGALVGSDGTVYDHIHFRPRGGCWRYAMGKNMWKFDFNKGHKFRAVDNWGQPYESGWSKLNLGACIQQGDYGMRGEQGLFESVGFRLFNLAGLPAPHTHFVQLRVITDPDETGPTQYEGDFWGLYLAVENVDDDFLKDHALPNQSVFKVDGMQPHWGKQGADKLTEADGARFVQSLFSQPREDWWRKNVALDDYYAYRSIVECIHHYDLDGGKNYFFRRDPVSQRWTVVPWDIDLTWGDHMFGSGGEPFYQAGALRHTAIRREYQNRLREIRDLLFNPEQTGALIDEYAALIATPVNGQTFAEADRRKWDHHPIMSSRYVMGGFKTQPGLFYRASPSGDLAGMARRMKSYVQKRSADLDAHLLTHPSLPATPKIVRQPPAGSGPARYLIDGVPPPDTRVQWHLGEFAPARPASTGTSKREPGRYEVTAVWTTNSASLTPLGLPEGLIKPGQAYRLRARLIDKTGTAGHYSAAAEVSAR